MADNRSWKANCKALVHAVDPIWRCKKFKEEPLLHHACTNRIKETEGYNSISISVMGFSTFSDQEIYSKTAWLEKRCGPVQNGQSGKSCETKEGDI